MDKKVKKIVELAESISAVDKDIDTLNEEKKELEEQLAEMIGGSSKTNPRAPSAVKKKSKKRATKKKKRKKGEAKKSKPAIKDGSRPDKLLKYMKKHPGTEYGIPALIRVLGYPEANETSNMATRAAAHTLVTGGYVQRPRKGVYVFVEGGKGGSSTYYDNIVLAAVTSKRKELRDIVAEVQKKLPEKSYSAISAKLWQFAKAGTLTQTEKGKYQKA